MKYINVFSFVLFALIVFSFNIKAQEDSLRKTINTFFTDTIEEVEAMKTGKYNVSADMSVDSVRIATQENIISVRFNPAFSHIPFRPDNVNFMYTKIRELLPDTCDDYTLKISTNGYELEKLIPYVYRTDSIETDSLRIVNLPDKQPALTENVSTPLAPESGLKGDHIALWHSHGWYYERELDRWEYQRARLLQTVEDLYPMSYTLPFLIPMLENAGATVLLPRERDTQTNEVVADNDTLIQNGTLLTISGDNSWFTLDKKAFARGTPPYQKNENPFRKGSAIAIETSEKANAFAHWIPDIPEKGKYAVYVSYVATDSSITDAHYTVHHAGGKTRFRVNQQMGGRTWVYLGTFHFEAGYNPMDSKVVLSGKSQNEGIVTADAVRFGGGMGKISRNGKTSGRASYQEAARYYLQYAGMPDSLVYNLNEDTADYIDDYQCRGEWVNYLRGDPYGPTGHSNVSGLDIPVDLSFAFHTDAGNLPGDSIKGTLAIFDTQESSREFPGGESRLANRDFADMVQTQIVNDIRRKYDSTWTRRGLWDRKYSEAYRPNVPAMLLELLSHQNFADMKFGMDPEFRFDVSRAIYKGMLKFLAYQNNRDYIVQPLPVDNVFTTMSDSGTVKLSWEPVIDSLAPSADPESYIVYKRTGAHGFDNGTKVDTNAITFNNLHRDTIYSFKVTAVNAGGESMPSEIVSVHTGDNQKRKALVINAFDRVSAPATIDMKNFRGFANFKDEGVPYKTGLNYVGRQYLYNPDIPWEDDDDPGFGTSYANMETTLVSGNTFDFPLIHGKSIKKAGWSFVSASDEAVRRGDVNLNNYDFVDIIFGEEKSMYKRDNDSIPKYRVMPERFREKLQKYIRDDGKLFISGAYVGTDIFENEPVDSASIRFAKEEMKYFHRTNHATKVGKVHPVAEGFQNLDDIAFNTEFNEDIYKCESPDAIEPADATAQTIFRYNANNMSAGVGSNKDSKVVVLGFPFETIIGRKQRNNLMKQLIKYLEAGKR